MVSIYYVRICFAHSIYESFYCNATMRQEILDRAEGKETSKLKIKFVDSVLVINPEYICLTDIKFSTSPDTRTINEVKEYGASR